MNVVEMHGRLEFYLDKVNSPRFKKDVHYDTSLNIAVSDFLEDRHFNLKDSQRKYAFDTVQKIRDQLHTLLPESPLELIPSLDKITLPSDYFYEVATRTLIDGKTGIASAVSFNDVYNNQENTFLEATINYPQFVERAGKFQFYHGGISFTKVYLDYIKKPDIISRGLTLIGTTQLIIGKTYYVADGSLVHASVTYSKGNTFVAEGTTYTTSNNAQVYLIVNCNLPISTHEEICRRAVGILSQTVEDYNREKFMQEDVDRN